MLAEAAVLERNPKTQPAAIEETNGGSVSSGVMARHIRRCGAHCPALRLRKNRKESVLQKEVSKGEENGNERTRTILYSKEKIKMRTKGHDLRSEAERVTRTKKSGWSGCKANGLRAECFDRAEQR